VKAKQGKRMPMAPGFMVSSYRAHRKRNTAGIVRLAVNTRLLEFRGPGRLVISLQKI